MNIQEDLLGVALGVEKMSRPMGGEDRGILPLCNRREENSDFDAK